MFIRNARQDDLDKILIIYDDARKYMRTNGNMHQWDGGYPSEELLKKDIENNSLYVVENQGDGILCVFAFLPGPDITYAEIYDGYWPENEDYYVIHRIAVSVHRKGVASFVFDECLKKADILRIDTHKDNIPMQNSLKKNGFEYCGIIHLLNGDERLAYRKERILK